jgi:ATPase subunit of ABC transporter with duplicated ATPase domains
MKAHPRAEALLLYLFMIALGFSIMLSVERLVETGHHKETNPSLMLESVSYVLPSSRTLFSQLDMHFDAQPTGLVGRNGVGKSVLADILTGRIAPTTGGCLRSGRVYYLSQSITPEPGATVADLAGIAPVLQVLSRIEAGGMEQVNFDLVGDRWDIRQRLRALGLDERLRIEPEEWRREAW